VVRQACKLVWAAPCSLVGLALGAVLLAAGAQARIVRGALEIAYRPSVDGCGHFARRLRYRAITFGHVILGVTGCELAGAREHEHVHVAQYERWGPLFFLAYPLAGFWQWIAGRDAYWDNPFEVEARRGHTG
jgi:hypothetical protein